MLHRIFLIFFLVLLLGLQTLLAQETPTTTPAPSKTASPTTTDTALPEGTESDIATEIPQETTELPRSYTQEDLSVLVGNVQRPNGFVYHDEYLFGACNGDWTLYQIHAITGETITFVQNIRNVHQMTLEPTEEGYNLWIPDFDTNKLMFVNQDRGFPRMIADENLDGPWGITPIGDRFLISNVKADNLVIADRDGNVAVAVEGLRSPAGLVLNEEFIYVANNGSARRAIEWFSIEDLVFDDDGNPEIVEDITQPLISGLQNVSNLVLADDDYLYFTFALGSRGVVGRVNPEECREDACSNDEVEIVVFTELPAPLAGLTITPDMRLFVHTIYRPELYWVDLYQ